MTPFRFAVALVAMALLTAPNVKATDLTVGSTSSGNVLGSASDTRFSNPIAVEVLPGDEVALVADFYNARIVNVSLADGSTNEFMTTGVYFDAPLGLAICDDGVGYFCSPNGVNEFNTSSTSPVATPWVVLNSFSLACLKNRTHSLLFAVDSYKGGGIRAYDRSNGPPANAYDFVWRATKGDLGVGSVSGISLSPDLQHLAFAGDDANKVGTINIQTKAVTLYGSGTQGTLDGTADAAQFFQPNDVAWTPDGSKILVNQYAGFSGLRFIDFATGFVSSSANDLMPSTRGLGVTVLRSTGEVVVTYRHGLKKMSVAGVSPLPPGTTAAPVVDDVTGVSATSTPVAPAVTPDMSATSTPVTPAVTPDTTAAPVIEDDDDDAGVSATSTPVALAVTTPAATFSPAVRVEFQEKAEAIINSLPANMAANVIAGTATVSSAGVVALQASIEGGCVTVNANKAAFEGTEFTVVCAAATNGASTVNLTFTPKQDPAEARVNQPQANAADDSDGMSGGAIVGLVVGLLVAISVAVGAGLYWRRKQKSTPSPAIELAEDAEMGNGGKLTATALGSQIPTAGDEDQLRFANGARITVLKQSRGGDQSVWFGVLSDGGKSGWFPADLVALDSKAVATTAAGSAGSQLTASQ